MGLRDVLAMMAAWLITEASTFNDHDSKVTWQRWAKDIHEFKEHPATNRLEELIEFLFYERKDFGINGKAELDSWISKIQQAAGEAGLEINPDLS